MEKHGIAYQAKYGVLLCEIKNAYWKGRHDSLNAYAKTYDAKLDLIKNTPENVEYAKLSQQQDYEFVKSLDISSLVQFVSRDIPVVGEQ